VKKVVEEKKIGLKKTRDHYIAMTHKTKCPINLANLGELIKNLNTQLLLITCLECNYNEKDK